MCEYALRSFEISVIFNTEQMFGLRSAEFGCQRMTFGRVVLWVRIHAEICTQRHVQIFSNSGNVGWMNAIDSRHRYSCSSRLLIVAWFRHIALTTHDNIAACIFSPMQLEFLWEKYMRNHFQFLYRF